jgi:transcriptional regulator NrdR family protein
MKIIKRSGSEDTFDIKKIYNAVYKANMEVVHNERLSNEQIQQISDNAVKTAHVLTDEKVAMDYLEHLKTISEEA